MSRIDVVETEIRPLFESLGTEVYGTPELAREGWDRITRAMSVQRAKEAAVERAAVAERRAERELRTKRGLATPVPTCTRCFSQHRGEC